MRGQQEVEVEQVRQCSFSYCLTQSRVRGVLSRETSNTGNPFRNDGARFRSPRRAGSDSAAPTEMLHSPASDRATSRTLSSMFKVVLMLAKLTG